MALLIGGFAFTANAQTEEELKKEAQNAAQVEKKVEKKVTKKTLNMGTVNKKDQQPKQPKKKVGAQTDPNAVQISKNDNLLAQYEAVVKECLAIYKGESDNKTSLDDQVQKALKLKGQIEGVKKDLTPTQAEKFKEINKDLDKVITKH